MPVFNPHEGVTEAEADYWVADDHAATPVVTTEAPR